jgi:hypothetical protein
MAASTSTKMTLGDEDLIAVIMEGIQHQFPEAYAALHLKDALDVTTLERYVIHNCKHETEKQESLNGIDQKDRKPRQRKDKHQPSKLPGKQEDKSKPRCSNCRRSNHTTEECWIRKKAGQKKDQQPKSNGESSDAKTYHLFSAIEEDLTNWTDCSELDDSASDDEIRYQLNSVINIPAIIIDSGCTKHVIGTPHHQFITKWRTRKPSNIGVAGGTIITTIGLIKFLNLL